MNYSEAKYPYQKETYKIILEVKAQKEIVDEHYAWVINYLAASNCKLGLIVNFAENSLVTKRVIL